MSDSPFISYGQNREDVVLWRALGSIPHGRYVEVGANDPVSLSITKAFYDRGWNGISVEPDPEFVEKLRAARPRDHVVNAAVTPQEGEVAFHVFPGTGLSTLDDQVSDQHVADGWERREIQVRGTRLSDIVTEHGYDEGDVHFLIVDVEGAEADVLSTIDLTIWRPWVLVIESTAPLSTRSTHEMWEPAVLAAGYDACLFDGVSRFYVAHERAEELAAGLSYPACAHDSFVDHGTAVVRDEADHLRQQGAALRETERVLRDQVSGLDAALVETRNLMVAETLRWRRAALGAWASRAGESLGVSHSAHEMSQVRTQLEEARKDAAALRRTLSWRVTTPLRAVRTRTGGRR
ncbi:FkbM family methyltransferase [Lapillicoccus sp.]|uniref:FkbM family methyltransferase n=1 Tax=Lapillicoccus sp. TaxID=1909287 RepID=UPI003982E181